MSEMLNRLARYQPVIRFINENRPSSILEIGSGSLGIGEFCSRRFTGVDIAFEGTPVKHMEPVKISATELPFSDNAFDLVICLDVLEHINPQMREQVIDEALRVTKSVCILGFPCGKAAHNIDEKLYDWCKKKMVPVPLWLEEHMQAPFPEEDFVTSVIKARNMESYSGFGNEHIKIHFYILILEMHPRRWVRKIASLLRYKLKVLSEGLLALTNEPPHYRKMFIIKKNAAARGERSTGTALRA